MTDETTSPGRVELFFANGSSRVFPNATDIVNGPETIQFDLAGIHYSFKKSMLSGWGLPQ
mgnify:FL=1